MRPDRTTPLRSWLIGCLGFATATVGAVASPAQTDAVEPRVVCTDPATTGPVEEHDQLVIIIDDLGHNRTRGRDAIDLPGNITYAVIPFTHYGRELAEHAHSAGKEVMLHTPMSTVDGDHIGTGGLTADLSRTEFNTRLNNALADIPHVQGINNHMGSDLTQRRMQMGWLMQELRWQELYFVDSRTSGRTIAARIATEFSVPNLSREVFLDNHLDADYLAARFAEAVRHARRTGSAVLIGHPHRETIRYLREVIPTLAEQGIELVTVSQALSLSDKKEEDSLVAGLVNYSTDCQS